MVFSLVHANDPSQNACAKLLLDLRDMVVRVKRARRWHLVNKLTRAFVEACFLMRLKAVRSFTLMKAIIKAIKELREVVSAEFRLLKVGVSRAWKISMLASSWGHPSAESWRNDKAFILYQAITLKWLSRLFGSAILNEP